MNIILKKMETKEETRGKAYVHWKSWQEAYPGLVAQEYLDKLTLQKCEEIAFRWPENLIVAKDEGRVVGFVGYGNREEEPPELGEVFALYVLAEYYGTGVGRMLMDAALEQLKGYPQVCLWTLKENCRAIRFYRKCGFVPDGKEKANPFLHVTEIRMTLEKQN